MKKKLIEELLVLMQYLVRVHSQYKAFKRAQEKAEQNRNVATIQVDWYKNWTLSVVRKKEHITTKTM